MITGLATNPAVMQRSRDENFGTTAALRARSEPPVVEAPTRHDRVATLAGPMVSAADVVEAPLRHLAPASADTSAPLSAADNVNHTALQRVSVSAGAMPDQQEPVGSPDTDQGPSELDDTDRLGESPIADTPARSIPAAPQQMQRQFAEEPARPRRYGLGAPLPDGESGTGAGRFVQCLLDQKSAASVERAAGVQRAADPQRSIDTGGALPPAGALDAQHAESEQVVGLPQMSTPPETDQVGAGHGVGVRATANAGEGDGEGRAVDVQRDTDFRVVANSSLPVHKEQAPKPPTARGPQQMLAAQRAVEAERFTIQQAPDGTADSARTPRAAVPGIPVIQRRAAVDQPGAAEASAEPPPEGPAGSSHLDSREPSTAPPDGGDLPMGGVEMIGAMNAVDTRVAEIVGYTGEFVPVAASISRAAPQPGVVSPVPTVQRQSRAEDASVSSAAPGSPNLGQRESSTAPVADAARQTRSLAPPDSNPSRTQSQVQRTTGPTLPGSFIGHPKPLIHGSATAHDHVASATLPRNRTGIGTSSWNALAATGPMAHPVQRMPDLVSSTLTQGSENPRSAPTNSHRAELPTSKQSGTLLLQRRPPLGQSPMPGTPHRTETPRFVRLSGSADPRVLQREHRTFGMPGQSAPEGGQGVRSSIDGTTLHRAGRSSAHGVLITASGSAEPAHLQRTRTDTGDVPESPAEPLATSNHAATHSTVGTDTTSPPASDATMRQSVASGPPTSATAGASPTDIDGLVDRLYEPIARKLKAELRLARERAGVALDLPL
ncbi:hypothetical protein IU428_05900 [Nocardia abscessus]|uniref:hypothetical protein n=1 Tax=Nocardia abscessus TaxID=120957 RepID=UPI001893C155|nr:hypothetical protein [Nocardia abscessus]MBF6471357.1 hypothetical protein [Nocardia abscessus]